MLITVIDDTPSTTTMSLTLARNTNPRFRAVFYNASFTATVSDAEALTHLVLVAAFITASSPTTMCFTKGTALIGELLAALLGADVRTTMLCAQTLAEDYLLASCRDATLASTMADA